MHGAACLRAHASARQPGADWPHGCGRSAHNRNHARHLAARIAHARSRPARSCNCQAGATCSSSGDCGAGLYCALPAAADQLPACRRCDACSDADAPPADGGWCGPPTCPEGVPGAAAGAAGALPAGVRRHRGAQATYLAFEARDLFSPQGADGATSNASGGGAAGGSSEGSSPAWSKNEFRAWLESVLGAEAAGGGRGAAEGTRIADRQADVAFSEFDEDGNGAVTKEVRAP